jgi:hypothetical protein
MARHSHMRLTYLDHSAPLSARPVQPKNSTQSKYQYFNFQWIIQILRTTVCSCPTHDRWQSFRGTVVNRCKFPHMGEFGYVESASTREPRNST